MMYTEGAGVPVDEKQAFALFGQAASQGMPEAQYAVGIAYAEGKIVPTDVTRAAELFRDGAAQGPAGCQLQLFLMQYLGVAIPEDAVVGRYGKNESAEPATLTAGSSSDVEDGTVSEEYVAQVSTLIENYKQAAGQQAQPVPPTKRLIASKAPVRIAIAERNQAGVYLFRSCLRHGCISFAVRRSVCTAHGSITAGIFAMAIPGRACLRPEPSLRAAPASPRVSGRDSADAG
jgi:hypothetical protein